MDFIKRHYEKLLLLFMLVLFIGIMFYVVSVAEEARSIKTEDLRFDESKLKRNKVELKSVDDSAKIVADGRSRWEGSTQRSVFDKSQGSVPGPFSDLVVSPVIATCPHSGCKNLIPRYYFKNNFKCPACGEFLADVPARAKTRLFIPTENDLDGDGMPNSYETSKNFKPNDAADQLQDADRDGFSNLYEYEADTDPRDPRSRMPLWFRLRYVSMESVVLPIKFKSVSNKDYPDNKKKWILQFSRPVYNKRGRPVMDGNKVREADIDCFVGDELKIEDRIYKITDVTYDQKTVGGSVVDNSSVRLEQVISKEARFKPDVLTLKAGREVLSNDKRLIVEDMGFSATNAGAVGKASGRPCYIVRLNGQVRLGTAKVGYETYILRSVNERAKTAEFHRTEASDGDPSKDANGNKIIVTRDSEIPADVQVTVNKPAAKAPEKRPGDAPRRR